MKRCITRRNFVKASTAMAIPMIVPSFVIGADAPSNKLNVAGIGIGNQGRGNINACRRENIIALCDVDHKFAARTFKAHPKATKYKDFRVMFDKEKDIDAVVIATPDHTHAQIAITAMKKKIHVFCQKPLTHDIFESRLMAEVAKKYNVVTQMGIQGHAGEGIRLIQEWIQDGAIGTVREVDAWCSLMYSPPGHAWWSSILQKRPEKGQPIPEGLDWDSWLGPSPERPYHRCYHPSSWRCWWDFGCGMMGDRGAHTLDPVYTALKLGYPDSIKGSGVVGGNEDVHPDKAKVVYKFPKRDGFPELTINWYEGQVPPRPEGLEKGRRFPREGGSLFKGDKGMIWAGVYGNSPRLIPETAMRAYKRPARTLPRSRGGIFGEWLNAIKKGGKSSADFSYSGPLTEVALLGNLAKKFPGKELKWDGKNMKVTNHEKANEWIKRPRRKGWEINA